MMNRHGLIAGATGTGKTKGLQGIAEQLSEAGVPVFAADMKGDLSGLSQPGGESGIAADRWKELGETYTPTASPSSTSRSAGSARASPSARPSPTSGRSCSARCCRRTRRRSRAVSLVFRYADQKGLPLLDLSDLRSLLTFLASEDGKAELTGIGGVASADDRRAPAPARPARGRRRHRVLRRAAAPDRRPDADRPPDGRGIISCLELPAVQDKPTLFSTALMWLLAELFEELPEIGDRDKPKLVFFFDEAHLLFDGATKAFLDSIVQTVRLIRSKGVGVFFCTQQPKDIPADVLAQLGNRMQYALRAFTPDDAKALKATVSTFPRSDFYDLAELLTQLGIGEAAVTILSESGVPTPVVATKIRAPRSKMAAADDVDAAAKASPLFAKYGTRVDAQSARELLAARMAQQPTAAPPTEEHKKAAKAAGGGAGAVGDFLKSTTGRQLQREVVRGLFGLLSKSLK